MSIGRSDGSGHGRVGTPERAAWNERRRMLREERTIATGDFIRCLECGEALRFMGTHLARRHNGMTAEEYIAKHRVPMGDRLCCTAYREWQRHFAHPNREAFIRFARSQEHIQNLKDTSCERGKAVARVRKVRPASAKQIKGRREGGLKSAIYLIPGAHHRGYTAITNRPVLTNGKIGSVSDTVDSGGD